jgi:hypothetical protein
MVFTGWSEKIIHLAISKTWLNRQNLSYNIYNSIDFESSLVKKICSVLIVHENFR